LFGSINRATPAQFSKATAKERPGSFREHDIEPFPGGMRFPDWTQVPVLIRDWIGKAQALRKVEAGEFPERLAELHVRFEQVHPFLDGNGRAGRVVLNLLLVRRSPPWRPRSSRPMLSVWLR
jgi:Fic family protein